MFFIRNSIQHCWSERDGSYDFHLPDFHEKALKIFAPSDSPSWTNIPRQIFHFYRTKALDIQRKSIFLFFSLSQTQRPYQGRSEKSWKETKKEGKISSWNLILWKALLSFTSLFLCSPSFNSSFIFRVCVFWGWNWVEELSKLMVRYTIMLFRFALLSEGCFVVSQAKNLFFSQFSVFHAS